jgi:hypothetical protein
MREISERGAISNRKRFEEQLRKRPDSTESGGRSKRDRGKK